MKRRRWSSASWSSGSSAPRTIQKNCVFTHRYALNPFNQEKIPIWIANYILMDYGTGAIMSVPAHDERDHEFAQKYGLEIRVVILPRRVGEPPEEGQAEKPLLPYTEQPCLLINSGDFDGLPHHDDIDEMCPFLKEH